LTVKQTNEMKALLKDKNHFKYISSSASVGVGRNEPM